MVPVFSAGEALVNPAIGSKDQPLANERFGRFVFVFRFRRLRSGRGAGLNRERMTIRMQLLRGIFPEVVGTIVRDKQSESEKINPLVVTGVDPDLAEIDRSRINRADACPLFAAIFRTKNAT